jgi:hypothetical protein
VRTCGKDVLLGGQAAAEVDVDATGVDRLRLMATNAGDSIDSDHEDCAEVRVKEQAAFGASALGAAR